jgi:hypothetical protein
LFNKNGQFISLNEKGPLPEAGLLKLCGRYLDSVPVEAGLPVSAAFSVVAGAAVAALT